MACNVETFAYPSWWAGATTVQISYQGGNTGSLARSSVEFLPQGVAWGTSFMPWASVTGIDKLT